MKVLDVEKIASRGAFNDDLVSHKIECVNWAEYPYRPEVSFKIAYDEEYLYIKYSVVESNVKAQYLEDNESVWCDSCVEFFVKDPDDAHYYNFEFNCIGTMLAARRTSKVDAERLSDEKMARVIRASSLPHERIDKRENSDEWSLMVGIPFDIIGHTTAPSSLKVNLYKCGDETQTPHFVSWSPIGVEQPNFHLPEFFGVLNLK